MIETLNSPYVGELLVVLALLGVAAAFTWRSLRPRRKGGFSGSHNVGSDGDGGGNGD